MKKIIVNGRFLTHRTTGVERYAREILLELDRIIQPNEIEMVIPPEVDELPQYKNIEVKKIGKLHGNLWEQICLPIYSFKTNGVSLNLCNAAPLLSPGIVCIHDMKIKAKPEYFSKKFRLWYTLLFSNETWRAKKIITVSEFSKREIIKYYSIKKDKITVIPNAWQHYERIGYDENTLNKYGLERDNYYFSMCSLEPNKNFKWIAEVAKKTTNSVFAVAGSINEKVFANGLGFECPDNMKLLGYVSDEEAKTLMRDCKAFLFPTFYEGFGIPPLEAISAGCRSIIVSDTEVMHEIYGDSAYYIDPKMYELDISSIKPIETDILNKYSWSKSSEIIYKVIKDLLDK